MKRTTASPNWTSRKRNEKLERFWQTAVGGASSVNAFNGGRQAFVGFSQHASEFSLRLRARGAAAERPSQVRIERFYMEGAGPSALVVGLPGGVGLVLEPTAAAVRRVWTGDFPDLAPVRPGAGKLLDAVTLPGVVRFRDAGEAPVRPGDARRVPTVLFQGYTWAEDRVALRYRIDGQDVTDHLRVLPGGAGVERRWDTGNDRSVWSHVSEAGEVRTLARDEQGRLVLDLVWERVAP